MSSKQRFISKETFRFRRIDERGFVSLTALLIVLMLAYLIRGTIFTAGNYADMTRNFETESRLQLAADSVLANEIDHIQSSSDRIADYDKDDGVDELSVKIKVMRRENITFRPKTGSAETFNAIVVLAIAKKGNYFAANLNAYRSACGFLQETETTNDDGSKTYEYKFRGLLSRSL